MPSFSRRTLLLQIAPFHHLPLHAPLQPCCIFVFNCPQYTIFWAHVHRPFTPSHTAPYLSNLMIHPTTPSLFTTLPTTRTRLLHWSHIPHLTAALYHFQPSKCCHSTVSPALSSHNRFPITPQITPPHPSYLLAIIAEHSDISFGPSLHISLFTVSPCFNPIVVNSDCLLQFNMCLSQWTFNWGSLIPLHSCEMRVANSMTLITSHHIRWSLLSYIIARVRHRCMIALQICTNYGATMSLPAYALFQRGEARVVSNTVFTCLSKNLNIILSQLCTVLTSYWVGCVLLLHHPVWVAAVV